MYNSFFRNLFQFGISRIFMSVDFLLALLITVLIERVTIRGKVTAVCPKKGCWVTLENTQNVEVFVKMKDYAFFLPQNIAGKTILLDAKVTKQETSVKELRHYAEDAGKSKEEITKITKPKVEIRVLANGIKVID